jgi:tetratricopeptide (TPR) repeat protein
MIIQSPLAGRTNLYKIICTFAGYFLMLAPLFCHAQGAVEMTELDDAMAKLQTGNYPAAIPQFAKVLEQYPDDYASNEGMGIALRETAQLDSVLLYLDHAIKIQPTAEAYWNRAALFACTRMHSHNFLRCVQVSILARAARQVS